MASMYPPYPPYDTITPAPPSVAETIVAGRSLSVQHKSVCRSQVRPLPKPAKPKAPKVTDVKMSRRAMRAHARCLRRHGAVLTDRLEWLAKPRRRNVIYLWREHGDLLPPETIERFRAMLNADEPFKPDQAYEYFINCRKAKKKANAAHCSMIKRDTNTVVTDKRFVWARNATVGFARGIQQRLSRPGRYTLADGQRKIHDTVVTDKRFCVGAQCDRGIQQRLCRPGRYTLADGMLRLSNVILAETCGYMKMRTPSRRSTNSKAKFMMEMADKIAVWIDEILSESDDRMLMMDFDEDEEVERSILDKNKPLKTPTTSAADLTPAPSAPSATTVATPATAAETGTPAVAAETGTPAASAETGTPAASAVTGTPAASAVTGTPTASAEAGTPAQAPAATPGATSPQPPPAGPEPK